VEAEAALVQAAQAEPVRQVPVRAAEAALVPAVQVVLAEEVEARRCLRIPAP
jgi:hypothetical protein